MHLCIECSENGLASFNEQGAEEAVSNGKRTKRKRPLPEAAGVLGSDRLGGADRLEING
jgi:hypothetical protein